MYHQQVLQHIDGARVSGSRHVETMQQPVRKADNDNARPSLADAEILALQFLDRDFVAEIAERGECPGPVV